MKTFKTSNARGLAPAFVLLALAAGAGAEEPPSRPPAVLAHDLRVRLDPDAGKIEATDAMTVRRNGGGELEVRLRDGLGVTSLEVDGALADFVVRVPVPRTDGLATLRIRVSRGEGDARVALGYAGVIRDPPRKAEDLAFVAGDHTSGHIGPEGVFLSESSGWVPTDGGLARYDLEARVLGVDWTVASQGSAPTREVAPGYPATVLCCFRADLPTDGLWLQAGKWKVERRDAGRVSIGTYLSGKNAPLSKLLMDAVEEYLGQYEKLLGPYPHSKFDVVENFFTTGYGMPSATLLGGDVIARIGEAAARSGGKVPPGYLDHELVHGWWGNGVFVDYASGNWCEALTTYCSNYLRKEWESPEEGARHRRGVRSRFAARVRPDRDYPLRKFTGKTEDFENDIGYGKGSMLFHQVRRAVGDEPFFGALRDVVKEFTGKRASWDDLRRAFEKRSGRNLEALYRQYLDRTGAPVVTAGPATVARDGDGWRVAGSVEQRGDPWTLTVPVVVETAAGPEATTVDLAGPSAAFSLRTKALPLRVLVDPDSQCWRGYAPGEVPPTLDATLSDPAGVECFLPGDWRKPPEEDHLAEPYLPVRDALKGRPGVDFASSRDLDCGNAGVEFRHGPARRSRLVLGTLAENGCAAGYADLMARRGVVETRRGLSVGGQEFTGDDVAVLLSFQHPASPDRSVTLYFGLSPAALTAARRVFFYGGDGVVVFKAGRPVLRLEPEGDESSRRPLLAEAFPGADAERAGALVAELSRPEWKGRLAGTPGGEAALARLEELVMVDDGIAAVRQPFSFEVVDWDGSPSAEHGAIFSAPFCFSGDSAAWVERAALVTVGKESGPEDLLPDVHAAIERGAKGVLVLGPESPPPALADYLLFPSALPPADRKRLEERAAKGGDGDPARFVEGRRSRLVLPDFPVPIPVVYVGQPETRSALPGRIRAPLTRRRIESANLLALIPGSDPALAGEAILLGAHHDHLGEGFPGADDDGSGCAALREAGRLLKPRRAWLGRSVILAWFGAEEWGLRGSRAFAASPPADLPGVVAALTLDTVGRGSVREVNVVGRSIYPALAAVVRRCLAAEGFPEGRDIDRFAFAWGSDHYALHAAGIPAVDLFSGDYPTMNTRADTPEHVDPLKLARLARAAAAFATVLSRGAVPR